MSSDATVSIHETLGRDGVDDEGGGLGLVIAWSAAEPERVGEVALVGPGESFELGRDFAGRGALRFVRQRPFGVEERPAVAGPGISRRQLKVRGRPGALAVESTGRCAMRIGDAETSRGILLPGDTLSLRGQLLLYCVERPRRMAAAHDFSEPLAGAFGEVDRLGFVGESPVLWELRDQLAYAAKARAHVLITGESGTGKELAARAIHSLSSRASGRFVSRNAATIPSGLVDAELFGNVKNYPNPGTPERAGMIGEASGGTLFLDEIGELPLELQAHLLRVLDGGEHHRLGESMARRSDLRLVGATNRDPCELKHDLAPRLALRVEVPALSDRREDIPLLVRFLLARAAERAPDAVERFRGERGDFQVAPELIEALLSLPLPGNIRDIDALLWSAMSESRVGTIRLPKGWEPHEAPPSARSAKAAEPATEALPPRPAPTEAEVRAVIAKRQGNLMRAAADLGLPSRYGLYRLLKKLGIALDELRAGDSR
jgi:DNA-binding NtrC family response regulator